MSGAPRPTRCQACGPCLARAWLLRRLSGHLEIVRGRVTDVLALSNDELIAALAGRHEQEVAAEVRTLDLARLRDEAAEAALDAICLCDPAYPIRLRALPRPPSVLYVAGGLDRALGLLANESVAIVGARRASGYGLEVARSLARGLGAAGVTVVSGMALGIDSAAHAGALATDGSTVAVLPGGADRPCPPSRRALYGRIISTGAVVSELPPGTPAGRWGAPARNRIIAALATMAVVVEAAPGSGALLTAAHARSLGRPLGAIPGRVNSALSAGPNELLRSGASLIRGPHDVLDELFGPGTITSAGRLRPPLSAELERLLGAIGEGYDTVGALTRTGFAAERVLAALSELELGGYVRREPGGSFVVLS